MIIGKVCVLGGSGFIGRTLAHRLLQRGIEVRIPTRRRERVRELLVLPTAEVNEGDIHGERFLAAQLAGCDAVVNLVGVLHDGRGTQGFAAAHVELARKVIAACRAVGVARLMHMSALKADTAGPSAYLRSKGQAEALVRASGLAWTIFRPSVVFGAGDGFLNRFAGLARLFPILPLAAAQARFQPVYVEDVARAFSASLGDERTFGSAWDLCGPQTYSLRELVDYVARTIGKPRPIIALPGGLGYLQALLLEFVPGKPMTRDNFRSLSVDSVCDCAWPAWLDFPPTPLEAVAPAYLANATPRGRYDEFRWRAGR